MGAAVPIDVRDTKAIRLAPEGLPMPKLVRGGLIVFLFSSGFVHLHMAKELLVLRQFSLMPKTVAVGSVIAGKQPADLLEITGGYVIPGVYYSGITKATMQPRVSEIFVRLIDEGDLASWRGSDKEALPSGIEYGIHVKVDTDQHRAFWPEIGEESWNVDPFSLEPVQTTLVGALYTFEYSPRLVAALENAGTSPPATRSFQVLNADPSDYGVLWLLIYLVLAASQFWVAFEVYRYGRRQPVTATEPPPSPPSPWSPQSTS